MQVKDNNTTFCKQSNDSFYDLIQDIVETEEYPVPPRTRCGWLVCFYDKVAAVGEYSKFIKRTTN